MADSDVDISSLIGAAPAGAEPTPMQRARANAAAQSASSAERQHNDERRRIHIEAALASIRPDHLLKPARSAVDAWELADHFIKLYDQRYPK